jgi:1-acyl-sn-glycerol-3-phosphate acyltransferase
MMLFLRSLLFTIVSVTAIIFCGFLCLLLMPFPLHYRYQVLRVMAKFYIELLSMICGIRYQVEGLENIPDNRVGVVLSKHQSAWETFFLPTIFHDPAVIAKRELLWIPFFGWGLAASDPIMINRSDKTTAMQQIIKKGSAYLKQGRWILVFPEGTRTAVGHVGKYHLGAARLAAATNAVVIPVAHNAGYFWPKRGFIKRPGTIRVVIGPAIESAGRTPEEIMELAKNWIETTVTRIGGLVDKSASQ